MRGFKRSRIASPIALNLSSANMVSGSGNSARCGRRRKSRLSARKHGTSSGPGRIGSLAASARASSGRKARTGDYRYPRLARKHAQVPDLDRHPIRYSVTNRDPSRIARRRHTETFSQKGFAGRFPPAVFSARQRMQSAQRCDRRKLRGNSSPGFYVNAASFEWALPKMQPRPWPAPVLILLNERDDFAKQLIDSTAPMRLKTKK